MTFELLVDLAGCRIPDDDGLVFPCGNDVLAVGAKRRRPHEIRMAQKIPELLRIAEIPVANRFVGTARSQCFSVWSEGESIDISCVALKSAEGLTALRVPKPNGLVLACGDEGTAIFTECDCPNGA